MKYMCNGQNAPIVNVDFTALCDLGKYTLDKIEKLCGFLYNPKGTEQEAIDRYVERIKEQNLPAEIEAAKISNARKDIKYYSRQKNIVHSALEHIQENKMPLPENDDEYDEEWFSRFFECAKHVAKEDMQKLWGRILANELSSPGSVTKQLLHVMSIIEREQAIAFSKLCSYSISTANNTLILCDLHKETEFWKTKSIELPIILELESLGLLSFNSTGFQYDFPVPLDTFGFKLNNESIYNVVSSKDKIKSLPLGNVGLTKTGLALCKSIDILYPNDVLNFITSYFEKRNFIITKVID